MRTLKFNGEFWYEDQRPLAGRILRWLAWFGGWEAHAKGDWSLMRRLSPELLTPVSLFGHRVTFYAWGLDVRIGRDHLVIVWSSGDGKRAYLSTNGTPADAHTWFYGEPRGVREAAARRGQDTERGYPRWGVA